MGIKDQKNTLKKSQAISEENENEMNKNDFFCVYKDHPDVRASNTLLEK
jgi:hypothetical protein